MIIKIESEEQFENLLHKLSNELVDACIHWDLFKNLTSEIEMFTQEYNQSIAFWTYTFKAHSNTVIFSLLRIFDTESKSLSLQNLLETIKSNLSIFETKKFKERIKDNPFVDSLAEDSRMPDINLLEEDLYKVSDKNELVKRLLVCRNNIFAHTNAKNIAKSHNVLIEYPLKNDDIEQLLNLSKEMLNRYNRLFKASTYSTQVVGYDDYKFVLESIRENIKRMDKEAEEDFER